MENDKNLKKNIFPLVVIQDHGKNGIFWSVLTLFSLVSGGVC